MMDVLVYAAFSAIYHSHHIYGTEAVCCTITMGKVSGPRFYGSTVRKSYKQRVPVVSQNEFGQSVKLLICLN